MKSISHRLDNRDRLNIRCDPLVKNVYSQAITTDRISVNDPRIRVANKVSILSAIELCCKSKNFWNSPGSYFFYPPFQLLHSIRPPHSLRLQLSDNPLSGLVQE